MRIAEAGNCGSRQREIRNPRLGGAAMQVAVLIATSGLLAGREFPVGPRFFLGRAPESDVRLPSPQVSRKHAVIEKRGEEFALTDFGSRNGTRVNGELVKSCLLRHGDHISIEEFGFNFVLEQSPERPAKRGVTARVVHLPEAEHTVAAEIEVESTLPRRFEQAATSEELNLFRKTYRILVKASEAFGLEHDLASLFSKILDYIFEAIPAHRGVIFVSDEHSADFRPVAQKTRGPLLEDTVEVSRTLLRKVADEHKAILTTNAPSDARFRGSVSIPLHDIRSAMCSPMVHEEELVGIVYLDTVGVVERFDTRGLELLVAISGPAAIAIKNARYLAELDLRARQLQKSYYDTLKVVVDSLEVRDYYTIGHGRRVALFAKIVAEEMGWSEERLKLVEMGGIIHDLGKIGIEDAILRKETKLTEAEMEQMQFHPEIGARLVRDVDFLKPILPYILYHQEHYDGTGYPHQLKGEEIPIEGRLLAVADTFDAMTSDRPYRKAMDVEKALRIVKEGNGRQFDPQVVEAFLRAWDKGRITKAMLSSAEEVKTIECPYCSSKIEIDPASRDNYLVRCSHCQRRARLWQRW